MGDDPKKTKAFGATDTGKVRDKNEDTFLIDDDMHLYVVADGMGGHGGGDVASRLAVAQLKKSLAEQLRETEAGPPHSPLYVLLPEAVREANEAVREKATEDPALAHMGTTLTGVAFEDGRAYLAHVGDSRAYRIRGDRIEQLSEDHTIVHELVKSGAVTDEQAEHSPMRHQLTRAIGPDEEVQVDVKELDAEHGDIFVLCSDGLADNVDPDEIRAAVVQAHLDQAPQRLVQLANHRGGSDNITVMVISVE